MLGVNSVSMIVTCRISAPLTDDRWTLLNHNTHTQMKTVSNTDDDASFLQDSQEIDSSQRKSIFRLQNVSRGPPWRHWTLLLQNRVAVSEKLS